MENTEQIRLISPEMTILDKIIVNHDSMPWQYLIQHYLRCNYCLGLYFLFLILFLTTWISSSLFYFSFNFLSVVYIDIQSLEVFPWLIYIFSTVKIQCPDLPYLSPELLFLLKFILHYLICS